MTDEPLRAAGRGRWRIAAALCTGLLCVPLLAVGVAAQEGARRDAGHAIVLETGKGRVLRLGAPVSAVFVADPAVADVEAPSPSLLFVHGKRAGATSIFGVGEDERIVFRHEVRVRHDLDRLRETVEAAVPAARVEATSIDVGLVLAGEVPDAAAAEDVRRIAERFLGKDEALVNRLRVASPTQVSLRVRVAEVSREVTKLFGINWDALFTPGNFLFGLATGRDFIVGNSIARLENGTGLAGGVVGGYADGSASINALIDALERENLVTVLAEPNLTAMSGETASFLAGGEFPIPVGRDEDEIEIEFKEFGVSLAFTPTVLSPDRISLRVRPEVSDLSTNGAITLGNLRIPAIATRRAETTVELASGQSFAIGGLISNETRTNLEKFPGLGDLPILGALFRSSDFRSAESELVIIVTPYLVRPVAPDRLRTPLDEFAPASDLERLLEARIAGVPVEGAGVPDLPGRLHGPAGFALD